MAGARRFIARTGQFIFSRIDARNGALGVVPPELDGAVVTNDFPVFEVDQDHLSTAYIGWMCRTAWFVEQCRRASEGTTNRVRLQEDKLLSTEIPLPALPEQRWIVARLDALASQISEARGLRQQVAEEAEELCRSILSHDPDAHQTRMAELVRLRPPDVTVRPDGTYRFAGVYCFGRGVFPGGWKSGSEFSYKKLTRLNVGDFVYPKLMAWEGALGIVPPECEGCVVSTEFPVFEVLEERVLPVVLDTYFRTPSVWPNLSGASTGTNVRRRRLNPADFLDYSIPLPSRGTQERLREVRKGVDSLKRLQSETAAELDALLPSLLDKAFKGEL
ncbi:MAG: restriction endonuclease subunit S [Nitrospirae bacterium]|nr:restriction endonuclease subunit S [Nitrospirota bacterium]